MTIRFRVSGWTALLAGVLLLVSGEAGWARSCRTRLVPNGDKFNCGTCHNSANGGGSRNPFGKAVETAIKGSGSCSAVVWSPALAALDSDGDGVLNGVELGDPDGTWTPGKPNPGDRAVVANPGLKTSIPPVGPNFLRGDADQDGALSISDAVFILNGLVRGGPQPDCLRAADLNDDGKLDLSDAVYLLDYLFRGKARPPAPFTACGGDATRDDLGCESFALCQ